MGQVIDLSARRRAMPQQKPQLRNYLVYGGAGRYLHTQREPGGPHDCNYTRAEAIAACHEARARGQSAWVITDDEAGAARA